MKQENMRQNRIVPLITVLLMFTILAFPLPAVETEAQVNEHRPVAELFSYIGCSYCVYSEGAIPKVMDSTDAVILEYHIWSDQAGWQTDAGNTLASQYGVSGTPAMIVDGSVNLGGADPSGYGSGRFQESCEDAYISAINSRPETSQASLSLFLEKSGDDLVLNTTAVLNTMPGDSLALRIVIYERNAVFEGHSYRNVVREVLQGEAILSAGQHDVSRIFDRPVKTQDVENLAAAVILYDTLTGEAYQSNSVFLSPSFQSKIPTPAESDTGSQLSTDVILIIVVIVLAVVLVIRWRKQD